MIINFDFIVNIINLKYFTFIPLFVYITRAYKNIISLRLIIRN